MREIKVGKALDEIRGRNKNEPNPSRVVSTRVLGGKMNREGGKGKEWK